MKPCQVEYRENGKVVGYFCKVTEKIYSDEQCKVCSGDPTPAMPPLIKESWNLVRSLGQFILHPSFVTKEEYAKRLETCEKCFFRVGRRCSECGCFIDLKAQVKVFVCPKSFWPVLSWTNVSDRLEDTLPPETEEDRHVVFNEDGSIRYDEKPGYDVPRAITGYKQDPDNPLRFLPLWPPCQLRHQQAVRYPVCGCIDVIMRCNNPDCKVFTTRVGHEACLSCDRRQQ